MLRRTTMGRIAGAPSSGPASLDVRSGRLPIRDDSRRPAHRHDEKSFWTGLDGHVLSGELAQALNIPPPGVGLLVQRVASGSPTELWN